VAIACELLVESPEYLQIASLISGIQLSSFDRVEGMNNTFNRGGFGFASGPSLKTLFSRRRIASSWRNGGAVITGGIIVICVLVWLVEVVLSLLAPSVFNAVLSETVFIPVYAFSRPWIFLSAMFLHATNLLHILFNMLTLWSIGPVLEKMMGHWRFLALYLLAGIGGGVGMMVWGVLSTNDQGWITASYGASGALFGLFASVLIVFRRIGVDIRSMSVWIGINFLMPFVIKGIAWQAHVGGFITGALLTWLLVSGVPALRKRSFAQRMWIYGSVVAALLLAIALLCNTQNPLQSLL
jgi:membrane associated rhomboid family serine protease